MEVTLKKVREAYREAKRRRQLVSPAVLQEIIINPRTGKLFFVFKKKSGI